MRKGFTLIEIVAVLVIVGVLAFAAVSVFRNDGMAAYAERDKLLSHLIYARAQGMAMGGGQCVAVSGTEVSFPVSHTGNTLPAGPLLPYAIADGVTVTPFEVCFDAAGSACGEGGLKERDETGILYCSGGEDRDIGFGDGLSLRIVAATGFVQ